MENEIVFTTTGERACDGGSAVNVIGYQSAIMAAINDVSLAVGHCYKAVLLACRSWTEADKQQHVMRLHFLFSRIQFHIIPLSSEWGNIVKGYLWMGMKTRCNFNIKIWFTFIKCTRVHLNCWALSSWGSLKRADGAYTFSRYERFWNFSFSMPTPKMPPSLEEVTLVRTVRTVILFGTQSEGAELETGGCLSYSPPHTEPTGR